MKRIATMAVTLAVVTMACGGGGGGITPPPASVDRSQMVSAVSEADKNTLCDWFAPLVGGYGSTPSCPDYLLMADANRMECVASFPVCTLSLGQFEDCIVEIVKAQNACTAQAFASAMANPNCQAAIAANCFN